MFKPNNSIITRNMHKVSLQNYATGLPHQREQKWQWTRPPTTPTRSQAHGIGRFSKSGQNLPLLWGKKERACSNSLAGICMKQAQGGFGDPETAVLPTAIPQPLPTPIHPIFLAMLKKPILNGKFPRKLRQNWVTPKDVIRNWRVNSLLLMLVIASTMLKQSTYRGAWLLVMMEMFERESS